MRPYAISLLVPGLTEFAGTAAGTGLRVDMRAATAGVVGASLGPVRVCESPSGRVFAPATKDGVAVTR